MRIFTFLANLQFVFQGSQKMHVRVAISQKFSEEEFQFPTRNISKMIGKSATVVVFLVDFVDWVTFQIAACSNERWTRDFDVGWIGRLIMTETYIPLYSTLLLLHVLSIGILAGVSIGGHCIGSVGRSLHRSWSSSAVAAAELLVETWFLAICHRQHTTVSPSLGEERGKEGTALMAVRPLLCSLYASSF